MFARPRFVAFRAFGPAIRFALFVLLVLATCLVTEPSAIAATDPKLRWMTIETEHFRITYHDGIEEVAQHVANVCEDIHGHMTEVMGHTPREKTEILLSDVSESANGSATALPYNAIRLLVTAPEDLSPLGDVDDWFYELSTHEYTHVLHTDNIHGLPALVNLVLGKTMAPNQVQPRWILEGYGVHQETARSSGGRLRNSMWDMYLRTDFLEDNVASLDQISNTVRRWPQGNVFYLYGSYFIQWIEETYGPETLKAIAADYGRQLIPWGIQRSVRRATGRTYDELYPAWIATMKRRYAAQAQSIRAQGLRGGVRLTHHGQTARYPRWIPKGAWPKHEGSLLYYRDDQRYRVGLFAVDITRDGRGNVTGADEANAELVARTPAETFASFLPDGSLVYGSQAFYSNVFQFNVLEKIAAKERSAYGDADGKRTRLTPPELRAGDPTVSPDGRRVVFTTNHASTRAILIGDLDGPDHDGNGVSNIRPLVDTPALEQSFTPRWSPDGTQIVYGVWKRGGYRDIRLVDVRAGTYRELTNDRASDGDPVFSADGKWIYFHSDRTGVMNVYAYELATNRIKQVTNVLSGAYCPEPSPDGKTLAYIGYTKAGFDLFAMRLDESTFTDAEPYVDARPPPPTISKRRFTPRPYNPWPTIFPRRYGVEITPGNFGQSVIVNVAASDISGRHSVALSSVTELEKPVVQGSLSYVYGGLNFDYSASAFRTIAPRGGYQIGQYRPTIIQETAGLANTIVYSTPSPYDNRSYVLTHSVSRVGAEFPMPIDKLDPYETPVFPQRGLSSAIHLGYAFTNAERYLWSVGPERGFAFSAAFDFTDPSIASEFSGFATNADLTTYLLMPWLRHHAMAFHVGAGTSGGNFPGRGAFFLGGFVDLPVVDTVRNILIQGGVTLRGYEPVSIAGRSYTLFNTEYRFPIVNIDRGDSTLPFFVNRINGNVFFDYGSAFDVFNDAQFKSGVGAELWFDAFLGYVQPFTFRLGYARGLASLGIDKTYFVAAVPY